jgi:hypothetical protein
LGKALAGVLSLEALTQSLAVTTSHFIEHEPERQRLSAPIGYNLAQIVHMAFPVASEAALNLMRVCIVNDQGQMPIAREHWHLVKPRPGTHIVIGLYPGKDAMRSILQLLVTVVATALGQFWIAPLFGGLIGSIATAAFSALGALAINALIPPEDPNKNKEKPNFAISGFRNQYSPDGVIPCVMGTHRFAPPFAARSWTEIVGKFQYIHAVVCAGYGPVEISDLRLGENPFTNYDEIQHEIRLGLPGDAPLDLYRRIVIEEAEGALLERPVIRDDFGDIIEPEAWESKPITRFTAADCTAAAVMVYWPAGLIWVTNKAKKKFYYSQFTAKYRLNGVGPWVSIDTVTFTEKTQEAFYKLIHFNFPARGTYELQIEKQTSEVNDDTNVADRTIWAATQSFRPEYPFNTTKNLAFVSVRIKATHQLNGNLENINFLVKRVCKDWDFATQTWIVRATENPASLLLWALQGPAARYPVTDAQIDFLQFQEFHDFCRTKNLMHNRVYDFEADWQDSLMAIAASGRASPRHDGVKWGVVIDRPQTLIVDHINPRNSRNFNWQRTYFKEPHAFRVPFIDAANKYASAERIVPKPGYVGPITKTERMEVPGVTDAGQAWIAASRRWYELQHRTDSWTAIQDGAVRVATRGDLVMGSFDVMEETQVTARVVAVVDNRVEVDEDFTPKANTAYSCRFIKIVEVDGKGIGISILAPIVTFPNGGNIFLMNGADKPAFGDIVHIGPTATESMKLIVNRVEPAEDMASHLTLIAESSEIDALTDAVVPPLWVNRYGSEIGALSTAPPAPIFRAILSGNDTTATNGLFIKVSPGPGSSVEVGAFEFDHRLVGAGTWTTTGTPAAQEGLLLTTYALGNDVEFRVRSISIYGTPGPYTATRHVVIGARNAATPSALIAPSVSPSLGWAYISAGIGTNTDEIRIYRKAGTGNVFNAADLKYSFSVTPGTTFTLGDGDSSRVNLIANPNFDSAANWTFDAGWVFNVDKATRTPAAASWVYQNLTLPVVNYRTRLVVKDSTAGGVQLGLKGSTNVLGTLRTANGTYYQTLAGLAGLTGAGALADATFAGAVDEVIVYQETGICLPQGSHEWWYRPFNDGTPGQLAGPFTGVII